MFYNFRNSIESQVKVKEMIQEIKKHHIPSYSKFHNSIYNNLDEHNTNQKSRKFLEIKGIENRILSDKQSQNKFDTKNENKYKINMNSKVQNKINNSRSILDS